MPLLQLSKILLGADESQMHNLNLPSSYLPGSYSCLYLPSSYPDWHVGQLQRQQLSNEACKLTCPLSGHLVGASRCLAQVALPLVTHAAGQTAQEVLVLTRAETPGHALPGVQARCTHFA